MSFWTSILQVALPAAATIYGASQTSKANDRAAQQATQAQREATAAELAALEESRRQYAINRDAASPGLLHTQEVIARGSALTPEQAMAVEDSRRQALNALKGSSLRGSARATSAIVSDTDRRVRNNFMTQNQNAADTAARGLAGQYFGANNSVAGNAAQQGETASRGLTETGNINAANTMGQGAISGQAIGDVGAIIADSLKNNMQKERDSSYGTYKTQKEADDAVSGKVVWN